MKIPLHLLSLLALSLTAHGQITWEGSTNRLWGTSANWDRNRVPKESELMVFPASASNKDMQNNLPGDMTFGEMNFIAPGYRLTGGRLLLFVSGTSFPVIQAGHGAGTTTIDCPLEHTDNVATFRSFPGATLAFGANADADLGSGILEIQSRGTVILGGTLQGTGEIRISFEGVTRVEAAQSHTGPMNVARDSTLVANAALVGALTVHGTLRGSGPLANTTVTGNLDPGDSGPGRLTVGGSLTLAGPGTPPGLFFDLAGTAVATQYDQLRVNGGLSASEARVNLRPAIQFPLGATFVLVDKTSAGPISGAPPFALGDGTPITEGTETVAGQNRFRFSYTGGNGNDFTARVVGLVVTPPGPKPEDLTVTPAGPVGSGIFATLSGGYAGGRPNGIALVQSSVDLASWRSVSILQLDATGNATLDRVADPQSEGLGELYFRIRGL